MLLPRYSPIKIGSNQFLAVSERPAHWGWLAHEFSHDQQYFQVTGARSGNFTTERRGCFTPETASFTTGRRPCPPPQAWGSRDDHHSVRAQPTGLWLPGHGTRGASLCFSVLRNVQLVQTRPWLDLTSQQRTLVGEEVRWEKNEPWPVNREVRLVKMLC